jgi:hypothetical protein
MDKVHKPITTQYYTPSSKPFGIYYVSSKRLDIRATLRGVTSKQTVFIKLAIDAQQWGFPYPLTQRKKQTQPPTRGDLNLLKPSGNFTYDQV